jgi:hypothetical protein
MAHLEEACADSCLRFHRLAARQQQSVCAHLSVIRATRRACQKVLRPLQPSTSPDASSSADCLPASSASSAVEIDGAYAATTLPGHARPADGERRICSRCSRLAPSGQRILLMQVDSRGCTITGAGWPDHPDTLDVAGCCHLVPDWLPVSACAS